MQRACCRCTCSERSGQPLRSEERDCAALRRARYRDEGAEGAAKRVGHEEDDDVVRGGEEEVDDVGSVLAHERLRCVGHWPVDVFQSETGA